MTLSVFSFRVKRSFESISDLFKNLANSISDYFHRIKSHETTQQTGVKLRKAKDRIVGNIRDNHHQLRRRNFDDHGFRIEDEDT